MPDITLSDPAPSLPDRMRAIAIAQPGGPEALTLVERPVPTPGPREILIRVAAAGINRPDILQREGLYPPPPGAPAEPGLEAAGTVVALGAGSGRWRLGDRVCALLPGGGYADYARVHETNALPVPAGLSLVEAAGVPETFFTVWTNVFARGRLAAGETFLVHGGTSGIGTTAIGLGKAFGARVIATAGSAEKAAACLKLGADAALDYRTQDFVAEVKRLTGGKGADLVLDMVGGDYIARNQEAAAIDGRIVQIAFLKGSEVALDLRRIMLKRLTFTGSTLRSRPVAEKAAIALALETRVWPLLARGIARPVIHATLPLEQAAEAHRLMESGSHVGKIVLVTGLE